MMKERFAESEFLAGVPEKLGGAICMQVIKKKSAFKQYVGHSFLIELQDWGLILILLFPLSLTRREVLENFCGPTLQPPWE